MDSSRLILKANLTCKTSATLLTIIAYVSSVSLVASQPTIVVHSGAEMDSSPQNDRSGDGQSVYQSQSFLATTTDSNPYLNQHQHQYVVQKSDPSMQLYELSETSTTGNNNITCNDGTPIGYYMRLNRHSRSWVIYLQGGGFCGSEESCQQRWQRSPQLMSSNFWPKNKTVDGILSPDPKENPFLWNANHIYVPYCSSDSWTGLASASFSESASNPLMYTNKATDNNKDRRPVSSFTFMGSKIIERVLESLYEDSSRDSSLHNARYILLAGDSAGATGVILNLDKVDQFVQEKYEESRLRCAFQPEQSFCYSLMRPVLRGLSDSGWFLDNEPYDFAENNSDQMTTAASSTDYLSAAKDEQQLRPKQKDTNQYWQKPQDDDTNDVDCDKQQCTPLQSIRKAMIHWNGQVPQTCAKQYTNEPWRCYFGYRAYQTLKTPLFVVQWLYDEAQLMFDNIGRPDTSGQWDYVGKVVSQMKASLENVTALFAPSCFSHSLITRQSWNQININGIKLPFILNSWEEHAMLDLAGISAIRIQAGKRPNEVSLSSNSPPEQSTGTYNNNEPYPTSIDQFEPYHLSQNHPQASIRDDNDRLMQSHSSSHVELRRANHHRTVLNTPRARGKKKKRNNSSQQQRSRQVSPRPRTGANSNETPNGNNYNQPQIDWHGPNQMSDVQLNQAHEGIINRTRSSIATVERVPVSQEEPHYGSRSSRSTIYDETGLVMNGNNVPDDTNIGQYSTGDNKPHNRIKPVISPTVQTQSVNTFGDLFVIPSKKNQDPYRFRLMDICGWPQCNRDCPILDQIGINLNPP